MNAPENGPEIGTDALHVFPTAPEIVTAVREWLVTEVVPGTDGSLSFHARVAANLLATLERELADDHTPAVRWTEALASFGVADEDDLALRLRDGSVAPGPEVLTALREATTARLRVSNPRYLTDDVDDDPRRR